VIVAVVAVRLVEVTIVQIIYVATMVHGEMSAARPMLMRMVGMDWGRPVVIVTCGETLATPTVEAVAVRPQLGSMRRVVMVCATVALAACAAEQPAPDYADAAARLDQARAQITPPLGATTYTLDRQRLLDQPGDENRTLGQSLEQLPGVTLGPNGQVRVPGQ
jgi:hypothetical protein